jgi:hypothetical protein
LAGVAAWYLAAAFLAAMPYFLLVVDYPGATTAAQKVALVVGNYASMYAMYVATYMVFGIALAVVVFALHDRSEAGAPVLARTATAVGLFWALVLVGCGMVFTYGMTTVVGLARTDLAQATLVWQTLEPVALGLGGAGGEFLGGLWVLLVGWSAVRSGALPRALAWLGVFVGAIGLASVVPALHDGAYAFGLLLIVWFAWLGVVLVAAHEPTVAPRTTAGAKRASTVAP